MGAFPPQGLTKNFFQMANSRWGNKFLGTYMFYEVGGKQLDLPSRQGQNRSCVFCKQLHDAAIHFVLAVEAVLVALPWTRYYAVPQMRLLTSEYALYWFELPKRLRCGFRRVFSQL
jgi:hypothetical protein